MIKNYNQYIFENIEYIEEVEFFDATEILESIITDSESLLKSIEAEKVELNTIFELGENEINSIEDLYNDQIFNKSINKKGYGKNRIEYSKDFDTFLEKTLDIKFFLIFEKLRTSLDPSYLVFQHKVKTSNEWSPVEVYKIKGNMRKFYDRLSNKTIELKKGGRNYIYITSNSGADWVLKNIEDQDQIFRKLMSNDDIKNILSDKEISLTIIA